MEQKKQLGYRVVQLVDWMRANYVNGEGVATATDKAIAEMAIITPKFRGYVVTAAVVANARNSVGIKPSRQRRRPRVDDLAEIRDRLRHVEDWCAGHGMTPFEPVEPDEGQQ